MNEMFISADYRALWNNRYKVERLPNGFIRCDDRVSGLVALYNSDGTKHSGTLRVPASVIEYFKFI